MNTNMRDVRITGDIGMLIAYFFSYMDVGLSFETYATKARWGLNLLWSLGNYAIRWASEKL